MSSSKPVPETGTMASDTLSADDAWRTVRRYGGWPLLRDAFLRFRYGDGFSHARALGLQLSLAALPFLIALTGLLLNNRRTEAAGELALTVGLLTAMVALTVAIGQIERGANRIYGVERDRPVLRKYSRAFVLAVVAGLPAFAGFLALVAGGSLGQSVQRWYGWGAGAQAAWRVIRWPLSLGATVLAVTVLFRYAPRRRQPGMSWLMTGAGVAFAAQLEARRVGVPEPTVPDRWQPRETSATG